MHDQIPVNHPVGSTRCGTARTSRAALVALALLALPGLVRAWDPNDAEVEAAIRGGNFAPLMANLTAWLNARTPAAPREISEGTLSAAFREPGFATALARRQFIAKVGVQPLDDFARRDPAVHPFLSWLLRNPEAMELCLEGATPVALAQRSADAWAIPVAAMAIWARIWQGDPDSREGLYLKMAIATGLSPPGTGNQGAGQAAKPADPLARHRHFKSAHRNGELFPTFAGLTVWDLRQIMSSNASDEDLAWGRAMVNTWVPQMKAGQKVVDTTSLVWRRNSPIPFDNTFKNVLAGGGKCGPRSSWAVFICQAWGIPAIGLAQPAHAAVGYKDVDGQWKTAYGRSWAASRTAWGSGNEFIEGMEQRLQVRKFMLVERLRWLAAALTPKERGGRVLDLAVALARTPAWLDTAHLAAPPETIRELPSFEAPPNAGDNFTARVRGFVHPPASGEFVFYLASDDDSDLFLSSDEHPGGKKIIAWVRGCTGAKDFDGGGTRQSLPVRLAAGRKYYIEALHREFDGPDHLAVAWSGPGLARAVIPGSHLSPYPSGARGSIAREAWQNPAAPAPAQTPPAPEPPAPTAPGVLHIDAASFFTDGGITIWGGRPGVPLVNSEGGGRQAFFQGSMPSAWAGYRLTVPAPGLYELTARVAAGNKDQSLYTKHNVLNACACC
jgi:hypothetical protein